MMRSGRRTEDGGYLFVFRPRSSVIKIGPATSHLPVSDISRRLWYDRGAWSVFDRRATRQARNFSRADGVFG